MENSKFVLCYENKLIVWTHEYNRLRRNKHFFSLTRFLDVPDLNFVYNSDIEMIGQILSLNSKWSFTPEKLYSETDKLFWWCDASICDDICLINTPTSKRIYISDECTNTLTNLFRGFNVQIYEKIPFSIGYVAYTEKVI